MKNTIPAFIFISLIVIFSACKNPSLKIEDPDELETSRIKEIGDMVSKNLTNTLKGELKSAISEGGFQNAIQVCNIRAIPLTELTTENRTGVVNVKRISNNYRNPLNAPDSIEKLALNHYTSLIGDNKEMPAFYIQKITENNQIRFRFYKPIMMEQVCLGCHGESAKMDSALVNQLAGLYPEDKATGYQVDDFRGLISVTIRE